MINPQPMDYATRLRDDQLARAMTRKRMLTTLGIEVIAILIMTAMLWLSLLGPDPQIVPIAAASMAGPLLALLSGSKSTWCADFRYLLLAVPLLIAGASGVIYFRRPAARAASYVVVALWMAAGFLPLFAAVCDALGHL